MNNKLLIVLPLLLLLNFCTHENAPYCEVQMEYLSEGVQDVVDLAPNAKVTLRGLGPYLNAIDDLGVTLRNLYRSCNEDGANTITTQALEELYDNLVQRTNEMKQYWYKEFINVECGPWPGL